MNYTKMKYLLLFADRGWPLSSYLFPMCVVHIDGRPTRLTMNHDGGQLANDNFKIISWMKTLIFEESLISNGLLLMVSQTVLDNGFMPIWCQAITYSNHDAVL